MVGSSSTVQVGWFDRLKNSLHFEKLAEKLNFSKYKLLDMALFLAIGFLIGFLWKRYANYIIAFVLFCTLMIILHHLDLISVQFNWIKLQECCGVEPAHADADLLGMLWSWAKMNVLLIFSFIIGICFGAKVS